MYFAPLPITRTMLLAGGAGCMTVLVMAFVISSLTHTDSHTHPIGTSYGDTVHVHADFLMYINNERIRFTDQKYQSTPEHAHHASLHFHDGNDEVIHRHADGVTLADFFQSIGMTITNECLTLDTGSTYCTNERETLLLMVNGEPMRDIERYIIGEEDQILLYYGDPNNPNLPTYINQVTDMACMYSGTCPEKGTPPTEGCGLTCEVADQFKQSTTWWERVRDVF
jgi:hypothetical protein